MDHQKRATYVVGQIRAHRPFLKKFTNGKTPRIWEMTAIDCLPRKNSEDYAEETLYFQIISRGDHLWDNLVKLLTHFFYKTNIAFSLLDYAEITIQVDGQELVIFGPKGNKQEYYFDLKFSSKPSEALKFQI